LSLLFGAYHSSSGPSQFKDSSLRRSHAFGLNNDSHHVTTHGHNGNAVAVNIDFVCKGKAFGRDKAKRAQFFFTASGKERNVGSVAANKAGANVLGDASL